MHTSRVLIYKAVIRDSFVLCAGLHVGSCTYNHTVIASLSMLIYAHNIQSSIQSTVTARTDTSTHNFICSMIPTLLLFTSC